MRISTSTYFKSTLGGIQDQQAQLARLSQKIAENKSYLSAREAPLNASRAMDISNSLAIRKQDAANQDLAELSLKYENTLLGRMQTSLSDASSAAMGVSPSQDQTSRDQIAARLTSAYGLLKDIGNMRDAEGNYVFAGHESATRPYDHTPIYPAALPGVPPFPSNPTTYAGDNGARQANVGMGRSVQTSDDLSAVFLGDGSDAQDLLQSLDYAAAALKDSSASAATVQSALDTASAALTRAQGLIQGLQVQVAGRISEVVDARSLTKELVTTEQNALGSLNDLDMAGAIIELQQRQTHLEASQRTFSLVSDLSLFRYLG
jgi:flagellar hook-associated protein 3 FlgL